ncbi:MAG: twin-arginine translocase subunit TatC, partial [Gemmatimonadetes bacterium]
MPFLDHLEELRWRILKAVVAALVGAAVGFVLVLKFGVLEILIEPVNRVLTEAAGEPEKLKFLSPTDPFFLVLKTGVLTGLILASPVIIYQVWAFLAPALEPREKRVIVPSLYFGVFLFAAGVFSAYRLALPATLEFLLFFAPEYWDPMLTAGPYLGFVTKLLVAFGVIFELPVVVMILTALGLVTPGFLRRKRRHAIVAITALASLLSPGDVITETIMMM